MIQVFADAGALARAAAAAIAAAARETVAERGTFRIALSGGTSPLATYRELAAAPESAPWPATVVLLADERAVPPDHPESNARLVRVTLLDALAAAGRAPRFVRPRGELADLDAAASAYEPELATPLDLLVLGVGPDGHTASLFPGAPATRERERRVLAVHDAPKPPPRRITVTPRAIAEARRVIVIATGGEKATAVAAALGGAAPAECPAALARAGTWMLDGPAGAGVSSAS